MSVVIRKVRTALQAEYRKAGGIRIDAAIAQAAENLDSMSAQCLERIDAALAVMVEKTSDPDRQLDGAELRTLHALTNDMLACCAASHTDGLADTLYAVGGLLSALMVTEVWIDGALTPAVNLLRLVRRGAVSPDDVKVLVEGVDQCARRVRAHAQARTAPNDG